MQKEPDAPSAILPGDEMAALERQLAPAAANDTTTKDSPRKLGFVSAGVESQPDGGPRGVVNHEEDIELPEESDGEEEDVGKVEISQKEVPAAVFGGLVRKREGNDDGDGDDDSAAKSKDSDEHLGALERIKRMRRGG